MKTVNKSKVVALGIPAIANGHGTDISSIDATLFHILRKKKSADVSTYGIPTVNDDVFSRKIRLVKLPKKEALGPIEDIPDLEDVHHTDLPWIGQATFGSASRQFRSKNILACAVEVVREVNGYLYRLSIAIDDAPVAPEPVLVYLNKATPLERDHTLVVNRDITQDEREFYMSDAPPVPDSLKKELARIGYWLYGDGVFRLNGKSRAGTDIRCELYGKILLAS